MDSTNLKENASKLKDDLSKNIINVNDINVFLDSILNDENAKTSPDILPSTDRPLTENDIIALFKSFLKTKCDSKGNLIKTWSVSEKLSSSELEDILKYANDNESKYFIDATTDYILDDYENISTSLSKKLIAEFYDAIGLKEKDIYQAPPVDENLLEDCINDLSINVNAKQLLSQSSIDDLTIYFESEYDIMPNFIYMINKDNNLKFLTDKQYTALDWLLESQGYIRNDLVSVSKRNRSIFLKSLYEEIINHRSGIWYNLIAVPNTTDYAILLKLSRKGNVIIKKSTRFGLFNTHMNDACGINITLEKDIIVNKDTPITSIHLIYRDSTADTPCISGYKSPSAAIPNLRDTKTEDLEIYDKRNML